MTITIVCIVVFWGLVMWLAWPGKALRQDARTSVVKCLLIFTGILVLAIIAWEVAMLMELLTLVVTR